MPTATIARGFRRRLASAFVLVTAVTTGVVGMATYVVVYEYRTDSFVRNAEEHAVLAASTAPAAMSAEAFDGLVDQYRRAGFETIAVVDGVVLSSAPELGMRDIPSALRSRAPDADVAHEATTAAGEAYLVVAPPSPSSSRFYFFFSQQALIAGLRELVLIIVIGSSASVLVSAAFGSLVARAVLRPVREAASAAEALADGLLDTRLPPRADDEFGRWSDSFNRMAEALEGKLAELEDAASREKRFTTDLAHELRTPLTGMTSAASLLTEDLDVVPPPTRRRAELLIDDARRLEVLVLDLLALAHLDAGHETVNLEPLSVAAAVGAVVRSWDGDSTVEADVDPGLWVTADRVRFKSVLGNLVANALQHGGTDVCVTARRDGSQVAIDVLDRGPGLDPADLPHVFDRFFKADPSRADGGSGLGLSIAHENARFQHGSLEVANREGGGARFTFRLPACPMPG